MNVDLPVVNIDVRGVGIDTPVIEVKRATINYRFWNVDTLKPGKKFSLGIFFSKAVFSEDVFSYHKCNRLAVLAESPIDSSYKRIEEVVRRFPLILTHQQELINGGAPFRELLFGTNWLGVRDEDSTSQILLHHPEKTRLVSFMGSLNHPNMGAYKLRGEVAEILLNMKQVDCFGKGINAVPGKYEALAPYRFSVAMENAASDFYFSEKLIDCLLLETIPIYYGFPSTGRCFDERGILSFRTLEELTTIVGQLSGDLYERMKPFAMKNKEIAIANRWHSHQGVFERIADATPEAMYSNRAATSSVNAHLSRLVARVARVLGG